jgi:hypothetical protein
MKLYTFTDADNAYIFGTGPETVAANTDTDAPADYAGPCPECAEEMTPDTCYHGMCLGCALAMVGEY